MRQQHHDLRREVGNRKSFSMLSFFVLLPILALNTLAAPTAEALAAMKDMSMFEKLPLESSSKSSLSSSSVCRSQQRQRISVTVQASTKPNIKIYARSALPNCTYSLIADLRSCQPDTFEVQNGTILFALASNSKNSYYWMNTLDTVKLGPSLEYTWGADKDKTTCPPPVQVHKEDTTTSADTSEPAVREIPSAGTVAPFRAVASKNLALRLPDSDAPTTPHGQVPASSGPLSPESSGRLPQETVVRPSLSLKESVQDSHGAPDSQNVNDVQTGAVISYEPSNSASLESNASSAGSRDIVIACSVSAIAVFAIGGFIYRRRSLASKPNSPEISTNSVDRESEIARPESAQTVSLSDLLDQCLVYSVATDSVLSDSPIPRSSVATGQSAYLSEDERSRQIWSLIEECKIIE